MGAQPIAAPGWPELACCTMSAASTRTKLICRHSRLFKSISCRGFLFRLMSTLLRDEARDGECRFEESVASGNEEVRPSLGGR